MRVRIGYDIEFGVQGPTTLLHMLQLHDDHRGQVIAEHPLRISPPDSTQWYTDVFGNRVGRTVLDADTHVVSLAWQADLEMSQEPDAQCPGARRAPIGDLPFEVLQYLLPSRYCDIDSDLMDVAWREFGGIGTGWDAVMAISDYVHHHVRYDATQASPRHSALDTYRLGAGVCRDFAHLGVALTRALNIPARYVSGYLGDIRAEPIPTPMDFHAWYEVFLEGRWWAIDARHNVPRVGRVAIAKGRDAADVPLTMGFGPMQIRHFEVIADEVAPRPVDHAALLDLASDDVVIRHGDEPVDPEAA